MRIIGVTNGRMPCRTCEYKLVKDARHCQYASGCGFATSALNSTKNNFCMAVSFGRMKAVGKSIKMPRISAFCACTFIFTDSPLWPRTALIVSCTIFCVWEVSEKVPAPKKSSTYVNVRDGATRLIFLLSASPMTAQTMGATAIPKPQVSIIISKEAVSMNPISLALLGCQCS